MNSEIANTLFDESLRTDAIIWLAANMESPCDQLENFFTDEDFETIAKTLGVPLKDIQPLLEDNEGSGNKFDDVLSYLARNKKCGFLVRVAVPSPVEFLGNGVTTYGFGMCTMQWLYTEAFDQAFVERLLAWKTKYYAEEKKRLTRKSGKGKAKS